MQRWLHKMTACKAVSCIAVLLVALTGCVTTVTEPTSSHDPAASTPPMNRVELEPGTWVTLPSPADLGYGLTANQLITARWQDKENQLPVLLEVSQDSVVLAGFSSWGARILSLTYQDHAFATDVLPGLGSVLPKPEQVLFNLMLTLWPIEAWQQPLLTTGWQLKGGAQQRQLLDDKGNVVIDIHYAAVPQLDGEILFTHRRLGYVISIKTLSYSK